MENKVNFIPAINFINLLHTRRDKETKKIKQDPEKLDYDSFQCILMAEFQDFLLD